MNMLTSSSNASQTNANPSNEPATGYATEQTATPVLIIDDDEELVELVAEYLRREGFKITHAADGENGIRLALSQEYSVVVLDVMLPGIGGFDVLRRIRAASSAAARIPILMLTARGDEVDRVQGLELGADDYLPKPFSSRELVARLRAILRRATSVQENESTAARGALHVGDVHLDPATREVEVNQKRVELTSAEFDLLEMLLRSAGEIVSRDAIARQVLGRPLLSTDRSIDVHVSNLRRKLGSNTNGAERIKAIRSVGYLYAASRD
jgi:two-component system, OmpR family, response regulator CpxR